MRELRAAFTVLLLMPLFACGLKDALTPPNPGGCLGGVAECARTTRGIDGFAANPAYCPPWTCALANPDATPLIARIRVGETVKLQIYFSADLPGCGERAWRSVTWQSTNPGVVAVIGDPGFNSGNPVGSSGVLTAVTPGTAQVFATLHFDQGCYPARDEHVQLIVSADPTCLATSVCKTIDEVMVVPN
jgi:hypothetical protein